MKSLLNKPFSDYYTGGNHMNKSQLIDKIAKDAGLSKKDAEAALKATLGAIEGALVKNDKVVPKSI